MSPRKVAAYLLVFAGLAAYFYFFEVVGTKRRAEAKKQAKRLFKVEAPDVSRVLIKRGDYEIEIEKAGSGWAVTKPLKTRADTLEADSLVDGLTSISVEREMADAADLAPFGLNEPSLTVEFTAKSGQNRLLVGLSAPVGDLRYVMRGGEKKVLLVKPFAVSPLEKTLFQLRDKSLFTLKADEVEGFSIEREENPIVLKRKGAGWKDPRRDDFRVSKEKVFNLLEHLQYARAAGFMDGKKPNETGLLKPEIIVELEGKDRVETLSLGRADNQGRRYGTTSIREGVILVARSDVERLPKDASRLQDLTFIAFDHDSVKEVKFRFEDGTELYVEKSKDEWKSRAGESIENWTINALFQRLKDLEYSEKLKTVPRGDPVLAATLFDKDKKELLRVAFLKPGEEYLVEAQGAAYRVKNDHGRLMVQWLAPVLKRAQGKPEKP